MSSLYRVGKISVILFSAIFSELVKDTKIKLGQLIKNVLTNHMTSVPYTNFKRDQTPSIMNNAKFFTFSFYLRTARARSGHFHA